jgi:hypothetical protein
MATCPSSAPVRIRTVPGATSAVALGALIGAVLGIVNLLDRSELR